MAVMILAGFQVMQAKERMMTEKKIQLMKIVESATSVLEYYHKRTQIGLMTPEDAQKEALKIIEAMRYDGQNYLWITDDQLPNPKMIMHPTNPKLDGCVLDDNKYNCATQMEASLESIQTTDGKKGMFQAFVEVTKDDGDGFVTYVWTKPLKDGSVTKETYPKLAYVKKYPPWDM